MYKEISEKYNIAHHQFINYLTTNNSNLSDIGVITDFATKNGLEIQFFFLRNEKKGCLHYSFQINNEDPKTFQSKKSLTKNFYHDVLKTIEESK